MLLLSSIQLKLAHHICFQSAGCGKKVHSKWPHILGDELEVARVICAYPVSPNLDTQPYPLQGPPRLLCAELQHGVLFLKGRVKNGHGRQFAA